MNINRDDLAKLQQSYHSVITESQETSHNGGMNATEQYDEMKRKLDAGEITEDVWMRFCQDMLADILKGTGVEADDFKYL